MDRTNHWNPCVFILILVIRLASGEVNVTRCGSPGNHRYSYSNVTEDLSVPGTVAEYRCETGYLLVGESFRRCNNQGKWHPEERPFCMVNVAEGRRVFNVSSQSGSSQSNLITDGSIDTCSKASRFSYDNYTWTIDLTEIQKVDAVVLYFAEFPDSPITMYSGIHENELQMIDPSEYNHFDVSQTDMNPRVQKEVRLKSFLKTKEMRFFRIVITNKYKKRSLFSLCEVMLLSKSAISKALCSSEKSQRTNVIQDVYNRICYTTTVQDSKPWSSSNSKCKDVYNGFLVSNINKEKDAFLKQHLQNPTLSPSESDYWIGGYRNGAEHDYHDYEEDPYKSGHNQNARDDTWYWIRNNHTIEKSLLVDVQHNEKHWNCLKIDKHNDLALTSDICAESHEFICEYEPVQCGYPDKDDHSLFIPIKLFYVVGTQISYECQKGYVLEGETKRVCEKTGQWSGTAPKCNSKAESSAHKGLAAGVIVAIVLGSLAALIIIIIIVVLLCRKRRSGSQKIQYNKDADSAEALNVSRDKAGRSNYTTREEEHRK